MPDEVPEPIPEPLPLPLFVPLMTPQITGFQGTSPADIKLHLVGAWDPLTRTMALQFHNTLDPNQLWGVISVFVPPE